MQVSLRERKRQLRKLTTDRLRQISAAEKERGSRELTALLTADECWLHANTVLLFHAMRSIEPDTTYLIEAALQVGKITALPRIVEGQLQFRQISRPPAADSPEMERHPMGFYEPIATLPPVPGETGYGTILGIIPGAAFTVEGHRLGRGGGYYDRFLALHPGIFRIGICFSLQLVSQLPMEGHDEPLDAVCTELNLYRRTV